MPTGRRNWESTGAASAGASILNADRFGRPNRRRLSGPGLRVFLAISDKWGFSEGERHLVLGLPGGPTLRRWEADAHAEKHFALPLDALLRISAILGVHRNLRILFDSEKEAVDWLRGPHAAPMFGGQSPIALITCGTQDGIMLVRRYLDARCAGNGTGPNVTDIDFRPYTDADILFT